MAPYVFGHEEYISELKMALFMIGNNVDYSLRHIPADSPAISSSLCKRFDSRLHLSLAQLIPSHLLV